MTKKRRETSPCPIVNQNELFETKTNIPNFCGTVPLMQQVGKMVLSVVAWCEWTKVATDEVKRALQNEVGAQRLLNCDVEYLNYVWCGSMNVRQRSEIPINQVP